MTRHTPYRIVPILLLCVAMVTALFLSAERAHGQPREGDTLYLTSDQAANRAVTANPGLVRERLRVARARAEVLRGGYFPSLPELEYSMASDAPFDNEGEGEWELMLSQEFEIGGQYFLRRSAAAAAAEQTELEIRAVELAVRAEARSAFARLVAAEARLRLLDTLSRFAQRLDTIAAQLLAAEEISELERNLVHIERVGSDIERVKAESALADSRIELGGIIGTAPTTVLAVQPDGDLPRSLLPDSIGSIAAAIQAGDESYVVRRPDWQALERARARFRLERDLAERMWIPNVRLGITTRTETTATTGGGSETVLERDRLLGLHVGVGVPLPFGQLYDRGQSERAIADAEIAMIDAEQRLLASRIRTDVMRATTRLNNAARAYLLYTRGIAPLVDRNLELLERGYAAGELSATEVVTQQDRLLRTAEALIEAQREYAEALAEFERATAQ